MLRRKIDQTLINWKNREDKRALLIKGARQVGKTTSIRQFAKKNYECFVELNFERNPELKEIFSGSLEPKNLYLNMSAAGLGPFKKNKTVVFFDEIQSCPQARTAIKFLVEDGRYDYIESGSLLGINYREVSSYPVGFEEYVSMYPFDFEEFLWANNIGDDVVSLLKDCFFQKKAVPAFIQENIMKLYQQFLIVGGMPYVVQKYIDSYDINEVIRLQENIIQSYRDDIAKYAEGMKTKAKEVFDAIPEQLNKKNQRFFFSKLSGEPTLRSYEGAITWLNDAGVAKMCCNVTSPELPFAFNQKRNIFKLFICDTGLLTAMSYGRIQKHLLKGELSINQGSIVENNVAVDFIKKGFPIYYFDCKKPKQMEIDFLIPYQGHVLPIEVKSGDNYEAHPSITRFMDTYDNIEEGFIFCKGNVKAVGKLTYYPLYMAMFLENR